MYKHFTLDELKCKCGCDEVSMDPKFMRTLEALREVYGRPMTISSAYRCTEHPIERSKRVPGAHTTGSAVDVQVFGKDALELLRLAQEVGIHGIGISQAGARKNRFLHLDMAPATDTRPRPWLWSY